jgi:nitrogen fixation/metabolism regulation signal transduction histidine kinase
MTSPPVGAVAPAQAGPPSKRRIRNYLLDPRFQLKYAGLLVGVAMVLMAALGAVIWRTASVAAQQARTAADQAEHAMRESQTSSTLVRMQMLERAPDNPELVQTLQHELADIERQGQLNLARVQQQRREIEQNRRRMAYTLVGSALALMLLLGAAGIVITHKVVGPVFKLKRLLRQVGTGRLDIRERLRKGDELEDLFETFLQMCESLKGYQRAELHKLEDAIREVEASGAAPSALARLTELRDEMRLALGAPDSVHPPSP